MFRWKLNRLVIFGYIIDGGADGESDNFDKRTAQFLDVATLISCGCGKRFCDGQKSNEPQIKLSVHVQTIKRRVAYFSSLRLHHSFMSLKFWMKLERMCSHLKDDVGEINFATFFSFEFTHRKFHLHTDLMAASSCQSPDRDSCSKIIKIYL